MRAASARLSCRHWKRATKCESKKGSIAYACQVLRLRKVDAVHACARKPSRDVATTVVNARDWSKWPTSFVYARRTRYAKASMHLQLHPCFVIR